MKAIHFLSFPCLLLTAGSIGVRLAAFESLAVDDPLLMETKHRSGLEHNCLRKKKGTPPTHTHTQSNCGYACAEKEFLWKFLY